MSETPKPKILVIGDLMIDHYLWGKTDRISPEAPVQVIDVQKETTVLGGAGNVVNNLTALGSEVSVISVVGEDTISKELTTMLESIGANHYLVSENTRKTTKKSRIIASAQQIVRYDHESKDPISKDSEEAILTHLNVVIKQFNVLIVSDYGKGVITDSLMEAIIECAKAGDTKVLVDPKGKDYSKYNGSYLLTPNKKEAELATGITISDDKSLKKALLKLHSVANLAIPMITLSEDGIAILDDSNEIIKKPTVAREVFDVTGAGDTVIASLGYCLANGTDIIKSLEFANLAAGVVVGKIGSATANQEEIEEYKSSLHKSSIESHIKTFDEIATTIERLKKQKKKIVFTNGCFDILHRGHVSYLDAAKSLGDILILGLNSDESVRKLKGPARPINTQEDRAYILAALESVDYVVVFNDNTPYSLIQIVQPDVLVKGGDYEGKEVVGSDIAKEVKLIQFVDGKSTTNTIQKIQLYNS